MTLDEVVGQLGEPQAVYKPSPGQTFAGLFVCLGATAFCFSVAFVGLLQGPYYAGLMNLIACAFLAAWSLGFAYWIFGERKWRFAIFSDALVQVKRGGVQVMAWGEVRGLTETRMAKSAWPVGGQTCGITVFGPTASMVVSPINCRSRQRLFKAVLDGAERRGIPVQVEWQQVDYT